MVFGKSATATLTSDAGYINSGTTSTKSRFSQSLIVGYAAGGFDAVYRINQDVGSVYADRKSQNFGSMGGSQSQSGIGMNGGAMTWDTFGVHYIFAVSGREKIVMSTHRGVSLNPSKDTEPRAIIIKTTLPQLEN